MRKNDPVKHIMTTNVVTANLTEKYSAIKDKMEKLGVHHMPIVDGDRLVGIVSRIDILKFAHSKSYASDAREENAELDHSVDIEELMTTELVTLQENDTVLQATEILATSSFNSLPVLDKNGNLAGLITSKDLLGYLLEHI